jgi:hypothetical protein
MNPPTIHPLHCPICKGASLMPESELLRLPYTILFRCPYCQTIAVSVTTEGGTGGEARAA